MAESSTDQLWKEYGRAFEDFDDLTLARWLAQTLGQLQGRVWRFSHPLVGAYRLAAELAHDRQIWHKRLVTSPVPFIEAACCRAPLLPLFTRDVLEMGLICPHCSETAIPFDEIPEELRIAVKIWADQYEPLHDVAHWEDRKRKSVPDYDKAFEDAADNVERLLVQAGSELLPPFLDHYAAIVWEDQDECLEVRPDDIRFLL
jgi:hypothetical protein